MTATDDQPMSSTTTRKNEQPSWKMILLVVLLFIVGIVAIIMTVLYFTLLRTRKVLRPYIRSIPVQRQSTQALMHSHDDYVDNVNDAHDQEVAKHIVLIGSPPISPVRITKEELKRAILNRDILLRKCRNLDFMPTPNYALYDDAKYVGYNNCYFFSMCDFNLGLTEKWRHKPQPGQFSGLAPLHKSQLTSVNLVSRVLMDHPTAQWIADDTDEFMKDYCPCGAYKVFFMIEEHVDYHFVRQAQYCYVHKPGSTPVSVLDARGRYILNPKECSFDYSANGGPNYTIKGYFLVRPASDQVFGNSEHPAIDWHSEEFPMLNKI